jgi:putative methyltransferase (TIGR04325 family)
MQTGVTRTEGKSTKGRAAVDITMTSPPQRRLRGFLKDVMPPIALRAVRKLANREAIRFRHGYNSWEDASRVSSGYDTNEIVDKVTNAARLVHGGSAVYERDGVLFDEIQYSWPLLSSLLLVAAERNSLRVVDFGGGLGTTLQQNRKFFKPLQNKINWKIVEQKSFIEIGSKEFSSKYLSFFPTITSACGEGVDVILFGSSICFSEKPYDVLDEAIKANPSYIIFDRTPVINGGNDTFAVQLVSSSIYKAEYAIRNFNRSNLFKPLEHSYELIEEWICDVQPDPLSISMGFVLRSKDVNSTAISS